MMRPVDVTSSPRITSCHHVPSAAEKNSSPVPSAVSNSCQPPSAGGGFVRVEMAICETPKYRNDLTFPLAVKEKRQGVPVYNCYSNE